jgi:hypothetical protein
MSITVPAGRPSAGYRNETELVAVSAAKVLPTPLAVVIVPIFVLDPSPYSDDCAHCAYTVKLEV